MSTPTIPPLPATQPEVDRAARMFCEAALAAAHEHDVLTADDRASWETLRPFEDPLDLSEGVEWARLVVYDLSEAMPRSPIVFRLVSLGRAAGEIGPAAVGAVGSALAADLREMIAAWDTIEAATRRAFPRATDEERYRISGAAMRRALRLDDRRPTDGELGE